MVKTPPPSKGQAIFPPTPSTPAKLPYSNRRVLWPGIFLLNMLLLVLWLVGRTVFWIWRNKWTAAEWIWVLFWRGVTLLGVLWLVYDRVYEADATLTAPVSDPKSALEFPFVITNPSHVFAIRNVRWGCVLGRLEWTGGSGFRDLTLASGTTKSIGPGQVLNIDCLKGVVELGFKPVLTIGELGIALEYDADFFGLFSLHRTPTPTNFVWHASASNPQWIKGEPAR
jgi:hypothetical protein